MKKWMVVCFLSVLLFGCTKEEIKLADSQEEVFMEDQKTIDIEKDESSQPSRNEQVLVAKINGEIVSITLDDNATTQALIELLPFQFSMEDLHGNEKFTYLNTSLPTNSEYVGNIQAGDLMLYGNDCLVLFYEDFQTSFAYTRLGRVELPSSFYEIQNDTINLEITEEEIK